MANEIFYGDAPEDIRKCLDCTRPRCTNCLALGKRIPLHPRVRPIDLLDPVTREVVATYPSLAAAYHATGIRTGTIAGFLQRGTIERGYIWIDHEKGDDS